MQYEDATAKTPNHSNIYVTARDFLSATRMHKFLQKKDLNLLICK